MRHHRLPTIQFEAMKPFSYRLSRYLLVNLLLFALLATSAMGLKAQPVPVEKPMKLRTIMESLGRDMEAITRAISTEDWAEVTRLASEIANHPEPPISEKKRILTWLGEDAGKFRSLDMQVQEAATIMEEAAKKGDGKDVIAAFSKTQQHCLACHQNFRQPFIKQFYQTP